MTEPKFLTPQQLAERWLVPRGTVHSMASRGQLDAIIVRISTRLWRVDVVALEAFEKEPAKPRWIAPSRRGEPL